MMDRLEQLAHRLANNEINGSKLAEMVERNEISKQERRRITKISHAIEKTKSLTKRQLERRATKEKKMLPKLTKEDRKRKYHDELEREREKESANFTICLGCRKRGHFLKDCPKLTKREARKEEINNQICFNCGSKDHTLKNCPDPRDPSGSLPFASCFICKQKGHISRDCPENANGLYPNGGCCHICFQKTHLAKDCPDRTEEHEREFQKKREEGVRIEGLIADNEKSWKGDDVMLDSNVVVEEEEDIQDKPAEKKSKKRRMK